MRRPDLLVLIAIWEFLGAAGGLIGIVAIAIFALPYTWGAGSVFALTIAMVALAGYAGVSVAGGIGLLMAKEWGRILSIANAALSVFWVPVGTVIGILAIIYLTKPETREYFTAGGG